MPGNINNIVGFFGGIFGLKMVFVASLMGMASADLRAQNQPVPPDVSTLELVGAQTAVGVSASDITLGLWFRLKPGWKTYWRAPGDAGYPARVEWSVLSNVAAVDVLWPVPKRYTAYGLDTIGYENEVILPVRLRVEDHTKPVRIEGRVDYLACEEVCIPLSQDVSLSLPPSPAQPTPAAALIKEYMASVPVAVSGNDARHLSVRHGGEDKNATTRTLEFTARSPTPFVAPDLFVESPSNGWFSAPRVDLDAGGYRAVFLVETQGNGDGNVNDTPITATLVDVDKAWEATLSVAPPAHNFPGDGSPVEGFLLILGLAFLGGLVLNLMPCVLPVLSLKVLSVVEGAGGISPRVRFLAAAAGIMTSFLLLATALVLLQAAGQPVGWGIQFQQPIFLVVMALVVGAFACNLWGWLPITAPRFFMERAPVGGKDGLGSHFATGAFATLLATPCSAPFLGTAVGFALAGTARDIMSVFAVMGLGFCTPYLILAAVPGMVRFLPQPGPWMLGLKYVLGGLLAATALWLVWVISAQIGDRRALAVLLLLMTAGLGLFLAARPVATGVRPRLRPVSRWGAGLCGVAALFVSSTIGEDLRPSDMEVWQRFDRAKITSGIAAGLPVLVDVTADWCLTCKVNKALVLDDSRVGDLVRGGRLIALRADWTRPNPAIAGYLAEYGRYGIPFNIVYGPGAPEGIVLPELLTSERVMAALSSATLSSAVP